MTTTTMIVSALLLFMLVCITTLLYLIFRIRRIGQTVGSFECWTRKPGETAWTSGMARFGEDELQWYRLIGFSSEPHLRLKRRGMLVSVPQNLKTSPTVEITITSQDVEVECVMATQWYNGVVSWVESEAPQPRHLF